MKKTIAIFAIVFFGFFFALPASALTIDSYYYIFQTNGYFTDSGENFLILYDRTTEVLDYSKSFNTWTIGTFYINGLPLGSYAWLEIDNENRVCWNENYTYSQCKQEPTFFNEATFEIVEEFPAFSILNIPISALDDLFASAGTLFTDLWVIISIAIGVPLAFYIINKVIGMVNKRSKHDSK